MWREMVNWEGGPGGSAEGRAWGMMGLGLCEAVGIEWERGASGEAEGWGFGNGSGHGVRQRERLGGDVAGASLIISSANPFFMVR